MAIRLSPVDQEKLSVLATRASMSQIDLVHVVISALDEVELAAMIAERKTLGAPRQRVLRIESKARWRLKE